MDVGSRVFMGGDLARSDGVGTADAPGSKMTLEILALFVGLTAYRAACRHMGLTAFPLVQITINNEAKPHE